MPRTGPDATTENVIIRYLALCGAIVTVTRTPAAGYHAECCAQCTGCLSDSGPGTLNNVRDWASKHAGECRALPQPEQEN